MLANFRNLLPERWPTRLQLGLTVTPLVIAVVLLLLDRYGLQQSYYRYFSESGIYRYTGINDQLFLAQLHFSVSCVLLFIALPLLTHWLFPVGPVHGFGLAPSGIANHLPVYGVFLAIMLPVLWLVSANPQFYNFYPMYRPLGLSDWLWFELIYMLQFFAVEFFFRGFCLFRLEKFAGLYSIPLMTIPYALIHIHKPMPEALGSIVAGLLLGYLAIRTRSIWPGFLLHCGVALSMDVFSLLRRGWFASL